MTPSKSFKRGATWLRLFLCIIATSIGLYCYIDKQNDLVELRLAIPQLNQAVKELQEENNRLQYEIDSFESPIHLMELARKPEFTHLKYPYKNDVLKMPSPKPFNVKNDD